MYIIPHPCVFMCWNVIIFLKLVYEMGVRMLGFSRVLKDSSVKTQ